MDDNMGRCKVKFIKENIMGLDGVTPPTPPTSPPPPPPKGKPEAAAQGGGGGNGGGVLNKLEDGFFEGKGVSDIALRIAHDIPPDPENPLNVPDDPSEGYLKLLARYEEQYPPPVAQVDTLTVGGTIEEGDKFDITLDPEGTPTIVTYTAEVGETIEDVVAGLVQAWNDAFLGITAAGASPDITLTADVAGEPFIVTLATTDAGDEPADDQTFVGETTTENVEATEVTVEGTTEPDPDIVPPEPFDGFA